MVKYDVEPVKFLSINIDVKTFDRLIRIKKGRGYSGVPSLVIPNHYHQKLIEENEFVRLKCHRYYLDFKILEWEEKNNNNFSEFIKLREKRNQYYFDFSNTTVILISFGDLLDCNRGSEINRKNMYQKRRR
jgi:hypothetical protein